MFSPAFRILLVIIIVVAGAIVVLVTFRALERQDSETGARASESERLWQDSLRMVQQDLLVAQAQAATWEQAFRNATGGGDASSLPGTHDASAMDAVLVYMDRLDEAIRAGREPPPPPPAASAECLSEEEIDALHERLAPPN